MCKTLNFAFRFTVVWYIGKTWLSILLTLKFLHNSMCFLPNKAFPHFSTFPPKNCGIICWFCYFAPCQMAWLLQWKQVQGKNLCQFYATLRKQSSFVKKVTLQGNAFLSTSPPNRSAEWCYSIFWFSKILWLFLPHCSFDLCQFFWKRVSSFQDQN